MSSPVAGYVDGMLVAQRQMPVVPDLDALVELARWRPGLFLRQSLGPEVDMSTGKVSVDHESGVQMPGLSATTIDPEPWWTRSAEDWIARRICKYADLSDVEGRHPWLLAGHVVGYGPDHEPLVSDVEPVAWLDPALVDEAREHYHARFDVARDSTA